MNEFLMNVLFSSLECYAMYFLMFKLFKIDIYDKEMIFSSILMSVLSFFIREQYQTPNWDVFFQIVLMFLLVWMLFRIHFFYSIIMTVITFQAYMALQTGFYFILGFHKGSPISIYGLQLVTALVTIGLGWLVKKKRLGFDFIPDSPNYKISLKTKDIILFILTIPAIFFLTSTIYITQNFEDVLILLPVCHGIILISYLFISYRKDRSE